MATPAELLASIESAIDYRLGRISEGDYLEISVGDKRLKEYDLEMLFRLRDRLKPEAAQASGRVGIRLHRIKDAGGVE